MQDAAIKTAPTFERLTWEAIRVRYPDRWVVLVDLEAIADTDEFRSALVLGSGADRASTLAGVGPFRAGYNDIAYLYTGEIRATSPPSNWTRR